MIDITFILNPHRTRQAISSPIEFDRDSRCSVILDHVTCLADNSLRLSRWQIKDLARARDNSSAIDRTRGKKDSKEEAMYNDRDYGVRRGSSSIIVFLYRGMRRIYSFADCDWNGIDFYDSHGWIACDWQSSTGSRFAENSVKYVRWACVTRVRVT